MAKENYQTYGSDELAETMAAGGDIFREREEAPAEEKEVRLKLVRGTRDQLAKTG